MRRASARIARAATVWAALACAAACAAPAADDGVLDFPGDADRDGGGKADVFGRRLAGVASPYQAAMLDGARLATDARARREAAWATVAKVLEPVPLLGLLDPPGDDTGDDGAAPAPAELTLPDGEIPRVPRFETWYGIDDVTRMFQHLYEELGPAGRRARTGFSDAALAEAVDWNATALDRSSRWPLERYLRFVRDLGLCGPELSDDACVQLVQERTGGAVGGNARIVYSPATVDHVLRNYGGVLDCLGQLDGLDLDRLPTDDANFTQCFDREFPADAVLVKAQWARADIGKPVPAYDTDAVALAARLAGTAHWGDDGDRATEPSGNQIFTIRLRNGDVYRLVGLHIMTKELRHWQWITLWWSDQPDGDFGADRPAAIRALPAVWSNYKMCAVADYAEGDAGAAERYPDAPSLAAALRAIDVGPSWCSNPYLEHGRGNAGTNCVGCHQHGGSTVGPDRDGDGALDPFDLDAVIDDELDYPYRGRSRIREVFPTDYLYSFNRVDDFAGVIAAEVAFLDDADSDAARARIDAVLALPADPAAGAATFAARCTGCHGPAGHGTDWAPDLSSRVPSRDDRALLQSLIQGRGGMPAWGPVLADQELADVSAFLRETFGGGDGD